MSAPLCLMSSYCMAGHTGGGGWHEQARLASRRPLLCEARIFQLWAVTRRGEAAGRSRLVGSQARMPQSFWLSRINRTQGSHAPEDRLDPTEALDKKHWRSRAEILGPKMIPSCGWPTLTLHSGSARTCSPSYLASSSRPRAPPCNTEVECAFRSLDV